MRAHRDDKELKAYDVELTVVIRTTQSALTAKGAILLARAEIEGLPTIDDDSWYEVTRGYAETVKNGRVDEYEAEF